MSRPAVLRCAVYTRKSSDEGLEQSFNSLHAQREACEAYIRSQIGEGWKALSTHYDDGGFSGGSMERPGLKQLLADIAARRVDIVVVYKVDRLTRSLGDFARIVEVLDQNEASFVSVTQAFNTTTSMGRLTLNVLLSFAQFEREVTGERIRDKIAMSKARGMWMGGTVPLGYDLDERKLTVNLTEAELVRHIFQRYLELGSVHRLRDELEAAGVRSKSWTARTGRAMGGAIFNRGGIFHVLRNRLYLGEIVHKERRHPGLHPPIVEAEIFDAVQARLDDQAAGHRKRAARTASAVLTSRIFDAQGELMSPSFSYGKQGRRYRYYISQDLQAGRRPAASDVIRRINADAVEHFLTTTLSRLAGRPLVVDDLSSIVARLELRREETHVVVDGAALIPERHAATMIEAIERHLSAGEVVVREAAGGAALRIILPARLKLRGGRVWLAAPGSSSKAEANLGIVEALRSSHQELLELHASPLTPAENLADARSPLTNHRRQLARLPFLAPDLQRMILEGRQPGFLTLRGLLKSELPLAWADQRALLSNHHDAHSTP